MDTPPDEMQNDPVTCKIEFLDTTGTAEVIMFASQLLRIVDELKL